MIFGYSDDQAILIAKDHLRLSKIFGVNQLLYFLKLLIFIFKEIFLNL